MDISYWYLGLCVKISVPISSNCNFWSFLFLSISRDIHEGSIYTKKSSLTFLNYVKIVKFLKNVVLWVMLFSRTTSHFLHFLKNQKLSQNPIYFSSVCHSTYRSRGSPSLPSFWKKVSKIVGKIFFRKIKKTFAPPEFSVLLQSWLAIW